MTIRIPLDSASGELELELHDEYPDLIRLHIPVSSAEVLPCYIRLPDEPVDVAYPAGDDTAPLRDRIKHLKAVVDAQARMLDAARQNDIGVTREFRAHEARALAAVLRHFADEAER